LSHAVRRRHYKENVAPDRLDPHSLPQGIAKRRGIADARFMSADVLTEVAPGASQRILEDVSALDVTEKAPKESALERLEQAIGRDFADRLVAALSEQSGD
jgi:hypothetical protein